MEMNRFVGQEVPRSDHFNYFELIIHQDGEVDVDSS